MNKLTTIIPIICLVYAALAMMFVIAFRKKFGKVNTMYLSTAYLTVFLCGILVITY